jgi:hypothetical protein
MLTAYDRASLAHLMSLDLDPQLRQLLERRLAALITPYGDLADQTEWLILQAGEGANDIEREVAFSPLIEPTDGPRYGTAGFRPFWTHLAREDGHFVMTQTFGSAFAYILIIPDRDDIDPDLLALCREYTE